MVRGASATATGVGSLRGIGMDSWGPLGCGGEWRWGHSPVTGRLHDPTNWAGGVRWARHRSPRGRIAPGGVGPYTIGTVNSNGADPLAAATGVRVVSRLRPNGVPR